MWAQPKEVRAAFSQGGWTPERIAEVLPGSVGTEPMPLLEKLAEMRKAAAEGNRPNA